jgi:hypothetical protein
MATKKSIFVIMEFGSDDSLNVPTSSTTSAAASARPQPAAYVF